MILAVSLVTLLFASDATCQTVVTYSSKSSEELLCPITDDTVTATWIDDTIGNNLANYVRGEPDIEIVDPGSKHNNFIYDVNGTSFSLFIQSVQAEDGGEYTCNTVGGGGSRNAYTVVVEVLAKPTVKNGSQDVDELDVIGGTSYDLTCSATGARSVSELSLMWDPSLVENTDLIVTPNGNLTDYSITSTYVAKKGDSSITCQLTGYVMQDEINDQLITDTVDLNVRYAPMCSLVVQEVEDCTEVTLTCECDAVPADITQYSFFNGSSLISNGTINTCTESVAYGTSTEFSCSATNDIGPGDKSDVKVHDCKKGTTAPQSTNEPTSTKAMGTTTVEPESKSTDNPESGGLGTGAIVGISLGALAVVIVIVVIALMMFKPGKCGSKSDRSNIDNGIGNDGMEILPPPIYAEMKKKSNIVKDNDPTPGPRSSIKDTTISPKPQEQQTSVTSFDQKPPLNKQTSVASFDQKPPLNKQTSDPSFDQKPQLNEQTSDPSFDQRPPLHEIRKPNKVPME